MSRCIENEPTLTLSTERVTTHGEKKNGLIRWRKSKKRHCNTVVNPINVNFVIYVYLFWFAREQQHISALATKERRWISKKSIKYSIFRKWRNCRHKCSSPCLVIEIIPLFSETNCIHSRKEINIIKAARLTSSPRVNILTYICSSGWT